MYKSKRFNIFLLLAIIGISSCGGGSSSSNPESTTSSAQASSLASLKSLTIETNTQLIIADGVSKANFTIKALADGLVSFKWNFKTDDGHSTTVKVGNEKISTRSSFDPFGYLLNNVFVQLTQNAYKEDSQLGTVSFAVKKGDLFGFGAFSTTSNKGSATTTVSGFSFINEPSKAPSAVPVPAALWLMLVPMAGLGMFRKKA